MRSETSKSLRRQRDKEYQCKKRLLYPKNKTLQNKKYQEEYPDRIKANRIIRTAVRGGKLKRLPCVVCGQANGQAHHPDYLKPYNIIWLCPSHHKKVDLHLINIL